MSILASVVVSLVGVVAPVTTPLAEPGVTYAAGPCTINWVGGDGTWGTASNWSDATTSAARVPNSADHACIDDANAATSPTITIATSTSIAAVTNAETVVQAPSVSVTLAAAGEVANAGTWRLDSQSSLQGACCTTAHFVNTGTLDKIGTEPANFFGGIRYDDTTTGTITLNAGNLTLTAGTITDWSPTVAAGTNLTIGFDTNSHPSGTFDATGTGTVTWTGQITTTNDLTLSFEPGELVNQINHWTPGPNTTITNQSFLPFDTSTTIDDAFVNAPGATAVQRPSVSVTAGAAGVIANAGTWRLDSQSSLQGACCTTAHFVNTGTLDKIGTEPANFFGGIRYDDTTTGTITLNAGNLTLTAGTITDWSPTVAAGTNLTIGFDTNSHPSGTFDATGTGTVTWTGQITTTNDLTLSFEPGELVNQINHWTPGPNTTITNEAFLPFDTFATIDDAFVNAATGTVEQRNSSTVSIGDGGTVTNAGTWRLPANADLSANCCALDEHFVNTGVLQHAGVGFSQIAAGIVLDNSAGTVVVDHGTLHVTPPADTLVGTWWLIDGTLDSGFNPVTNEGTILLSGASTLDVGDLTNTGTIDLAEGSVANTSFGSFTNAPTGVIRTTIGDSAIGAYGQIVADTVSPRRHVGGRRLGEPRPDDGRHVPHHRGERRAVRRRTVHRRHLRHGHRCSRTAHRAVQRQPSGAQRHGTAPARVHLHRHRERVLPR